MRFEQLQARAEPVSASKDIDFGIKAENSGAGAIRPHQHLSPGVSRMKSRLDYHVEFDFTPGTPGGDWTANAPDLPGCLGQGSTALEARTSVRSAMVAWLDAAILAGIAAPVPFGRSPFGG